MKIAILFDSKYGNTKTLAEFMVENMHAVGHEVHLFRTKKNKPKELLAFQAGALLVGGLSELTSWSYFLTIIMNSIRVLI